jgi:hypothetical protein
LLFSSVLRERRTSASRSGLKSHHLRASVITGCLSENEDPGDFAQSGNSQGLDDCMNVVLTP